MRTSIMVVVILALFAIGACSKDSSSPAPASDTPAAAPDKTPAPAAAPAAGNAYDECKDLSIRNNKKMSNDNMPEDALKMAAENTCVICKQDPGGMACKELIKRLKEM